MIQKGEEVSYIVMEVLYIYKNNKKGNVVVHDNRAAIYSRLSVEDKNKANGEEESESIQNQNMMLREYAKKHGFIVYKVYSDDNCSGLCRERKGFCEMIEDAKKGYFDVVLCKTQSRFTRDMEVFEKYVHELFPLWGIRFISVVDNADSNVKGNKKARQINALINEWYSEDLSENIKMVLKRKMEQGEFVGAFACYGYQKSKEDRHKLVVDEAAADVVKRIFDWYVKGYGCTKIAKMLTEKGIMTPTMYKKTKGMMFYNPNVKNCNEWSRNTIKKILKNECYIGCLVQGKESKISYKNKKRIVVNKKDCVVIENNHEAIIDKTTFYNVQKLLESKIK